MFNSASIGTPADAVFNYVIKQGFFSLGTACREARQQKLQEFHTPHGWLPCPSSSILSRALPVTWDLLHLVGSRMTKSSAQQSHWWLHISLSQPASASSSRAPEYFTKSCPVFMSPKQNMFLPLFAS